MRARVKGFIFFSVYEKLFSRIAKLLVQRGVTQWSGFVWSTRQEHQLSGHGITYEPLVVFTRDLLPSVDDGKAPDLEFLARRERELGVSLERMLAAERHLLKGRDYNQICRMAEVALREIAASYDRAKPDFILSEDVSCFHSYAHFLIARERGIPFWCIGAGRLPNRINVYSSGFQRYEKFEALLAEYERTGIPVEQRRAAEDYIREFRDRPAQPPGMKKRAKRVAIEASDVSLFVEVARTYFADRGNPTAVQPLSAISNRVLRIARVASVEASQLFERPVAGERYVFYPLHYQPEATTLVQAPLYVDQVALLQNIAKTLPIGHRLYVKEHASSRGRRPLDFYRAIKAIPSVRLLGPDENAFALIQQAAVVVVITGTVGWEGLLFKRPVVTFGDVFFNLHPSVHKAGRVPKDGWYDVFKRAIYNHHHDEEALVRIIAALQVTSFPGFMGSQAAFPELLEPENVVLLATAVATQLGLG